MNNDYIGTNYTHAELTDDTIVKCEQFEEFKKDVQFNFDEIEVFKNDTQIKFDDLQKYKKETKDYLRIMQTDTIILQDKLTQNSIELKKEIEQLRKHTNAIFFSILSLLLIILSHQLYAIFAK